MFDDAFVRRFWSGVNVRTNSECWRWTRSTGSHGRGQVSHRGRVVLAHRVAWQLANGRLPPRWVVRQTCRDGLCCNPAHLVAVHGSVAVADNRNREKVNCPRGHPYEGENLRVTSRGHRACRSCENVAKAWRYQETKGRASAVVSDTVGMLHP